MRSRDIFRVAVIRCLGLLVVLLLQASLLSGPASAQETVTGVNPMPGFDHANEAGFPLTGRHAEVICESCHVNNQLSGTPRECVACHTPGGRARAKPANHPPAPNECSQCHTTANFVPFDFDHTYINQDCTTCHGAGRARSQPANHIPVEGSCDNCHITTGFTEVRVDHRFVKGECADCHRPGGVAPAQPANHIPVPAGESCGTCHSTFTFAGAVFDHMAVIDQPCASCHNNDLVIGKPIDHMPAPETCSDCHTPFFEQMFAFADVDHSVVPGDCASCHFPGNPWEAPYKPASHPAGVSEDCESCHNTFAFQIGRQFSHDEILGAACADCHFAGNTIGAPEKPVNHADITDNCEACHVTTSFTAVTFDHTETTGFCANCHVTGNLGAPTRPVWHTEDVGECDDCHTSTVAFADVLMNHNADSDDCSSCHIVNPSNWGAPTRPDWHLEAAMSGISCTSCHSANESPALSDLNHLVVGFDTADCQSCHALTSTPTPPPFHNGAGVTTTNCTQCHAAANDPTPTMTHTGFVNSECAECHFDYQAWTLDPNNPGSGRQTHTSGDSCTGCHIQPF